MKILICSISSSLGGMERRIENETKVLVAMGHRVFVATTPFNGIDSWEKSIARHGGEVIQWRPYKFMERQHYFAPFRWLAQATLTTLRKHYFDLAHVAIPYNFVGLSRAVLLQKARVPFVFSIHAKLFGSALAAPGQRLALEAMSGFVGGYAVSEAVRSSFMRLYDGLIPRTIEIDVIHNGIDTRRFVPDPQLRRQTRTRLGFSEDEFVVLLCGRLDSMKRPILALHGFAEWAKTQPRGRLLIVGEGPESDAVRSEVSRLGLQKRVKMTGLVPDSAPYYGASDCYISSSNNQEGGPLAAAEALASGLPAILPNDDVFGSLYGHCAAVSLIEPTHKMAWMTPFDALLTRSADGRSNVAVVARKFANERFASEVMESKLVTFYHDIQERLASRNKWR